METTTSNVIEVRNLTKIYNQTKVVNDVTFSVKKGEIFGFLGPNGAGKTTTIKAMLGLIFSETGEVKINGLDIYIYGKQVKKNIGYLPERVAFYDHLSALQNLMFYGELKNASKNDCINLLEEYGLKDSMHKRVGKFSKGMTQRLGIARALLGEPSILILDEPTMGLDPRGAFQVKEKIKKLKKQGTTVFFSSHILSEVQEVCDKVGILNKGVLVAQDSVSALGRRLQIKPMMKIELEKLSDYIVKSVKKVQGVEKVEAIGNFLHVVCDSKIKAKVIIAIESASGNIVNLQTEEASLEEVFMKVTEEA